MSECTCEERSQFSFEIHEDVKDGPEIFTVWTRNDEIAVCKQAKHAELIVHALNALSHAGARSLCVIHGVGLHKGW